MEKMEYFSLRFANEKDTLSARKFNAAVGFSLIIGILITVCSAYLFRNNVGIIINSHPIVSACVLFCVWTSVMVKVITSETSFGTVIRGYVIFSLLTGALCSCVIPYLDVGILINAALATLSVVLIMSTVAIIYPSAFSRLGISLSIALITFIVVEFLMMIFRVYAPLVMDWIAVGIFALCVGREWSIASTYPRTGKSAVMTACALHLNVINLFLRFASIAGSSKRH